jgi:hypothetical protein
LDVGGLKYLQYVSVLLLIGWRGGREEEVGGVAVEISYGGENVGTAACE